MIKNIPTMAKTIIALLLATGILVLVGTMAGVIGKSDEAKADEKMSKELLEVNLDEGSLPLGIYNVTPRPVDLQKDMRLEEGEELLYMTEPVIVRTNHYGVVYSFTGTTLEFVTIDGERQLAKFIAEYCYAVKYKNY